METETSLPTFDPNAETGNIYLRWTRWLRAFKLFVESKKIEDENKKKAMLLHYGGFDLQDIFYSIPEAERRNTVHQNGESIGSVLQAENEYDIRETYFSEFVSRC